MMPTRVAALYDIHGNLPALEAVLDDVRLAGVDTVVVGGDVVPGPMPRETIACLLDAGIPTRFIQGNGDRVVLAQMRGAESREVPPQFREDIRWTAEQIDPAHERLLAAWPLTLRVGIHGLGDVLFCHATPRSDVEIFSRLTPTARLAHLVEGLGVPLVVCGHTHMQFDRTVGAIRVVNAGSVGMPFGEPGAYWLLLGPDVQLRRTSYDLADAADRIRDTTYPHALEFAARNVVEPPSEREMLDLFVRAEPA
jgi:predicted phosphodiesterase